MVKNPNEKLLNTVFNRTRESKYEVHVIKFLQHNSWIKDSKTLYIELNKFAKLTKKRTIEEIGELMYLKQTNILNDIEIDIDTCIAYCKEVFTDRSLKGNAMELDAISYLNMIQDKYTFEKADDLYDTQFNVDLVGRNDNGDIIIHIQVKPESYKYTRNQVKVINESKEKKLGAKIYYLYYSYDGKFSLQ